MDKQATLKLLSSQPLGHQDQATTRIYLERVGVKRDPLSERLAERLGLGGEA